MTTPEQARGKRIHRLIMLSCGAFMAAAGLAAGYLAFSGEGVLPAAFYALRPADVLPSSAYRLPSIPAPERPGVAWKAWGPEAFALARREKRLVLAHWTSRWAHGCRLMEELAYADPEVRRWTLENVVAVRVDSDERPDLGRYVGNGWPTTSLLLPTGEVLSSGGFLPPERFLPWARQTEKAWRSHAGDIETAREAAKDRASAQRELLRARAAKAWTADEAARIVRGEFERLERDFDAAYGGFGKGRKFPVPQVHRFLAEVLDRSQGPRALEMLTASLDGELKLMDPVWGGLYRYAESPRWLEPHYEKLLGVQAEALRDFASAFKRTKEERYRLAAERIDAYASEFLRAGAFYASGQDADLRRRDGSWLEGSRYYAMPREQRRKAGLPAKGAAYSGSNAAFAAALIAAGSDLDRPQWRDRGLALLDRVWRRGVESTGLARHRLDGPGVGGLLEDELAVARAELLAFEKTGERGHLDRARKALGYVRGSLMDPDTGGYRSRPASAKGGPEEGWPSVDPDLTATAAMIFLDVASEDPLLAAEGRRLRAWAAARPELLEPTLLARLALRVFERP